MKVAMAFLAAALAPVLGLAIPAEPPSPVADFTVTVIDETTVVLNWSNVVEAHTKYILRMKAGADPTYDGETGAPLPAGSTLIATLDPKGSNSAPWSYSQAGLLQGSDYHFAIWRYRESYVATGATGPYTVPAGWSTPSFANATPQDLVYPDAVTAFMAEWVGTDSVYLTWKATGDDGNGSNGIPATRYDIRWNEGSGTITAANFSAMKVLPIDGTPLAPNSDEALYVTGLTPSTTYHFAIRVADNALPTANWGPLSSEVVVSTMDPPLLPPPDAPGSGGNGGCGSSGARASGLQALAILAVGAALSGRKA